MSPLASHDLFSPFQFNLQSPAWWRQPRGQAVSAIDARGEEHDAGTLRCALSPRTSSDPIPFATNSRHIRTAGPAWCVSLTSPPTPPPTSRENAKVEALRRQAWKTKNPSAASDQSQRCPALPPTTCSTSCSPFSHVRVISW